GFERAWSAGSLPDRRYDAVLDASDDSVPPLRHLCLFEPGGRVSFIGLSGRPSPIDTRRLVLDEITAVGVLSGSLGPPAPLQRIGFGARRPPAPRARAV